MIDQTGHRHQEQLRQHPATDPLYSFPYPLRGSITKVAFKDDPLNRTRQTVVDIALHGGMSYLTGVPISTPKASHANGEEWTPEAGDVVVVQFLNGRWTEPVVTGWLNMPDNLLQETSTDTPPGTRRYNRCCNGTITTIDKEGNYTQTVKKDRVVTVGHDETVTIVGDGTITVGGNITINVTGTATITAANVNITGNLNVTGNISATGSVADATGTIAAARLAYNSHTHAVTGGSTTTPTPQQ